MNYIVFTRDELLGAGDDATHPAHPDNWPEHQPHDEQSSTTLKAQPVHGVFGVERDDGTILTCKDGYGFIYLDNDGLNVLSLTEFEQRYQGAEHVQEQLDAA